MEIQKPHRRWIRFRLRTFLIVIAVLSVPLGWVGWELDQRRREKDVIVWVEEMGGAVYFHSLFSSTFDERSWWEKWTDEWFGETVFYVKLSDTPVSDLTPLAELKDLRMLCLDHSKVSDLSPLEDLNLYQLELDGTQVTDLSPLAGWKRLQSLNLNNTQVSDVSPLAELKNLRMLCLDHSKVNDLSPLAGLKKLEVLNFFGRVEEPPMARPPKQ